MPKKPSEIVQYDHQMLENYHPGIIAGVLSFFRNRHKTSVFKSLTQASESSGVSKPTLLQALKNLRR